MLERTDLLDPAKAPYGKPTSRIATPNIFDLVVVEDIPISPEQYRALPHKSPHPDYANNHLVLVWQGPVKAANNQVNVRRVYASEDDSPENWFNYAIKYSGDATTNPIYIRSYTVLRENYVEVPRGTPLTAVVKLQVTNRGSGYTNDPVPVVTITGGGGTGATASAIVTPDGKIIGLQLLTEGSGYTSNPTVNITHPDGTGAVAIAVIQPAGAVLVKEELAKLDDVQLDSIFVRVHRIYEVLPGPWIPYSRWDDELGPIQGLKRAVLFTDPPQAAISDVGNKTTYEARDGSSIVAMEQVETWGRDPYRKTFEIESSDPTPEKFRADVPTTSTSQIEPGRPEMPVLVPGELRRSSDEVNKFWRRESVTRREPPSYPRELTDYELGGIHTHGSEFGGTLETKHRLHNKPQTVEEGFDIIASKVEALGRGLTWRRTTRLFAGGFGLGPYIELLTGGDSYVDDPAVIFAAGDAGSGAAGTASVTETPIAIGDIDSGGVFTQTFASNGDANGVLNFLGKRYNAGVWRNPADAGNVVISAETHPSYPVSQDRLNGLADRSTATTDVTVVPQPGGGHFIMIDLGPGRTLKANKITLRLNTPGGVIMTTCRVYGFNKFGVSPTDIGSGIALPQTAGAWTNGALNPAVGYRYFWIYGLDAPLADNTWPILRLGEVELYGELTIVPGVVLDYAYNGDANGAFYYLGARGGAGTWRNPHTAGDIQITAPYDALAFGTFDSMVDREASNTYFVDRSHAEVWFDLGANRSLLLTTLTFRQRADYGSPMTQVGVQGSVDGVTWEESQQMTVSGVAGAWTKVNITTFTKYYRFFRLIIPTGKTFLAVGELELYGTLNLAPAGSPEAAFSVTGVQITAQGSNYRAAPRVIFSGGGPGTGAAGTAVVEDGKVVRVDITAAGEGYTSAPTVAFSVGDGGSGATASSTVAGGIVTALTLLTGGSGYTSPPKVKIVSSTGSGATAHAVLTAGVVTSIVLDSGGSGYARAPVVVLYPESDPEADAEIGFDINEITLVSGGSNYSSPPAVSIDGDGEIPARAVAVLGFPIASVLIDNPGGGFTSAPTPVFTGDGTGAAGTAVRAFDIASTSVTAAGSGYLTEPVVQVAGGGGSDAQFQALIARALLRIDMAAAGSGYSSDPTVVITGDGTGATAHVVRSFGIASIAVSAGGAGYTVAPTVTIPVPTGANGRQATAHAVLTAGAVTSIVIDDAGQGYLTAPTPTMTGGDGTGATIGAATLASGGAIDSVVIDTAGANFSEPPIISFTGGGGTLAAASAILNTSVAGGIAKVKILNAGKDYTSAPTLTILPGTSGGTGATATATLSTTGKIKSVTLTNPGSGYTVQSAVTFTGGGGSGATGKGVLAPTGSVKSITLLDEGDGFRSGATVSFAGGGGSGASATVAPSGCGKVTKVTLTKPGGPFTEPPDVIFVGGQSLACVGGDIDPAAREAWVTFTARFAAPPEGAVVKLVFVDYDSDTVYRGLDIRLGTYVGGGGGPPFPPCWEFNVNADPYNDPPYVNMIDPAPEADIDYNIVVHYELSLDGTSCRITPTINGIAATALETPVIGVFQLPYVDIDWPHASLVAGFGFGELAAGRPYSGDPTKSPALAYLVPNAAFAWTLDNLKIGTAGPGSSNLFNATFGASMAPFSEGVGFEASGGQCVATPASDPGPDGWPTAFFPIIGTMHPATAAYRLGSNWPTLREEQTDPTEKIIILIDKTIVRPETPLPPGYSEKFPLDIYRSIQIVSKVNLRSLPPPETWDTTQHVQFPQFLLNVYPIWDTNRSQATAGGIATGTQRGSVSSSVQVVGSIVVTKLDGFRGAALATVERQFFFGPPPRELVPEPTIIRPSSGTAITVTTRNSLSRSGLTYSPTGNSNPAGSDFASYAKSAGSSGATTQVVDLHDVLSAGIQSVSQFNASNASYADALNVQVGARGTFQVDLPASTPVAILPGQTILAQVGVEKWRFGLYVRTLIRVTVPALP